MRPFKVEFSRNRTRNLGGPINALTTGKREWEGEVGMTGNGSGRFCPRMAERGNGGVAHGTHGIHGIGDERREPRKRKGAEFFITKDATGVGRGPEKLPADGANEREWGIRDSEEWPTGYTDDTEWGAGTGKVAREWRERTRITERGFGRVAHGTHGIHGKGDERREPRKRKMGRSLFNRETHERHEKGGGGGTGMTGKRNGDLRGCGG